MSNLTVVEMKLMQTQADSMLKSGMLPSHFKNIHQVTFAIQVAKDLGLKVTQVLNNIAFIKGKLALSGQMMLALVRGSGQLKSFKVIERTNEICTLESERVNGDIMRSSYSIEDVKKAGLVVKDGNYDKYPKQMLYWRAVSDLCRALYPDVVFGIYTPEELESEINDTPYETQDGEVLDITPHNDEIAPVDSISDGTVQNTTSTSKEDSHEGFKITPKQKNLFEYKVGASKYSREEVKKHCGFEHLDEITSREKFDAILKFLDANPKEAK